MMFSIIDDMDRRERDYSIDFVKGVAILFVILLHNMPNESIYSIAYIGQAVPLFLLVSSYLTYGGFQRKGFNGYFSARNVKKMLDRVSLPFFLLIFSQCAIFYLRLAAALYARWLWSRILLSMDLFTVLADITFCYFSG